MKTIKIIPFNHKHINLVWIWRNDIQTIKMSLTRKKVTFQEHCDWSERIISSKINHMYIAEECGVPLGVVRFDENKSKNFIYDLTINIDPQKRGKGYGSSILSESIKIFCRDLKICKFIKAQIRIENSQSIKLFEKNGFKNISSNNEIKVYIYETKNN